MLPFRPVELPEVRREVERYVHIASLVLIAIDDHDGYLLHWNSVMKELPRFDLSELCNFE